MDIRGWQILSISEKIGRVLKIMSTALIVAIVILAILLYGVQLFGVKPYTVLSSSMEPEYPTGSIIYIKEADISTLEVGDVITFYLGNGALATHRISGVFPDEENPNGALYQTKGDNNETVDGSLVSPDDVVGMPVFCIPRLGYLATYISEVPGKYIAITVVLAIFILDALSGVLLEEEVEEEKETKKEKEIET